VVEALRQQLRASEAELRRAREQVILARLPGKSCCLIMSAACLWRARQMDYARPPFHICADVSGYTGLF